MASVVSEGGYSGGHSPERIDVLMYHSISTGDGPTCISPDVFAAQMAALADAGYQVIPLSEMAALRSVGGALPKKTAVITFDDAYADFAVNAAPVLLERGWAATVFAPTGWVGRRSGWHGAGAEALMDWGQIRDLSSAGIEFGSHSVSHRDLTKLLGEELRRELMASQTRLQQEIGAPARAFAAPYGVTNAHVRTEIARIYDVAVATRLARAKPHGNIYDVPRIEMHYFKEIGRWRRFLTGKGGAYFALRQIARSVRRRLL